MNLVLRYKLYNSLDVTVGPFDLNDIFGPFFRQENFVNIGPKSSIEVLCNNSAFHNEGVHERFSNRIKQLGIPTPGLYISSDIEKAEPKPKTPVRTEGEPDQSSSPSFSPPFGAPAQAVSMSQPAGTLPSDAQS